MLLKFFSRYRDSVPRILKLEGRRPPVLLFTDGACEEVFGELVATVGGVLFHPEELLPRAFGCEVSEKILESWMDADKVHPVSLQNFMQCVCREAFGKIGWTIKRSLYLLTIKAFWTLASKAGVVRNK